MGTTGRLLAAGALLVGAVWLVDSPRAAGRCPCLPAHNTPNFVGTGASCVDADNSVFDQADNYAQSQCTIGVCNESGVIVTVACSFNSMTGLYQETGHIHFGCMAC